MLQNKVAFLKNVVKNVKFSFLCSICIHWKFLKALSNWKFIAKNLAGRLATKCGVLQFKFYWNYHWKQALFFHLFLLHKPEAFFHANRCHELSHSPIQLDALSIMKNSAVACSFTLVFCTSQSDKKSLIRHHHHQVLFFRRIIVLFANFFRIEESFVTSAASL